MKDVYLAAGARTPFAKAGTDLKNVHAVELGRFALSELIAKTSLSVIEFGKIVDEVIIGNTGTPSDAANVSRVVALKAGLPQSVSAYTVHRNCASALEAINQAALKVAAGEGDVYIAGGTESMSQMPLLYNNKMVSFFETLSKAREPLDKVKAFASMPVKEALNPRIAIVEGLTDPFCALNMGQTAEVLAKEFKLSRKVQDEFALGSHLKTIAAQEAHKFNDEISPFAVPPKLDRILSLDSGPRKGQTIEALGKLKPYFDRQFGTVTVGNACPITDGAALVIVASAEGLKKLAGLAPLAKIKASGFAGLEPERMGLGPVFSTAKLLKRTGIKLSDIDVFEINEAFAAQVLGCLAAFSSESFCQDRFGMTRMGDIDPAKLNINGGAIAIGHPVGATGARIVLTAALEMRRSKANMALATLCIGGGQGGSLILEAC